MHRFKAGGLSQKREADHKTSKTLWKYWIAAGKFHQLNPENEDAVRWKLQKEVSSGFTLNTLLSAAPWESVFTRCQWVVCVMCDKLCIISMRRRCNSSFLHFGTMNWDFSSVERSCRFNLRGWYKNVKLDQLKSCEDALTLFSTSPESWDYWEHVFETLSPPAELISTPGD